MDFDDLIVEAELPPNRRGRQEGKNEHKFTEGAVMLAYAMHLLRTEPTKEVFIHPDGMHGKQFDFAAWLKRQRFAHIERIGSTSYGGVFADSHGRKIVVNPKSGLGDVVASANGTIITAECKGGIINTRHPGQQSKLYRGLCETVGLLMAAPSRGRQIAVVPYTEQTFRLATRLASRCAVAGIELALVKRRGEIIDVHPEHTNKN
jgi:hypothetical protein